MYVRTNIAYGLAKLSLLRSHWAIFSKISTKKLLLRQMRHKILGRKSLKIWDNLNDMMVNKKKSWKVKNYNGYCDFSRCQTNFAIISHCFGMHSLTSPEVESGSIGWGVRGLVNVLCLPIDCNLTWRPKWRSISFYWFSCNIFLICSPEKLNAKLMTAHASGQARPGLRLLSFQPRLGQPWW